MGWADLHGDGGARHRARRVLEQLQVKRADTKAAAPSPSIISHRLVTRQHVLQFRHQLASPYLPTAETISQVPAKQRRELVRGPTSVHDHCNTSSHVCRMRRQWCHTCMLHEVADVEARARLSVMLLQQVRAVQRAVVRIVHVGSVYLMILGVAVCDAVDAANDSQGEEDAIRNAPWPVHRHSLGWKLL